MKKRIKLVAVAALLLAAGASAFAELDLLKVQKNIALGKKTIVIPSKAKDSDLAAIVDCIKEGEGITLDLSKTKIKTIEDGAFEGCDALNAIILPKGLASIGTGVFLECDKLSRIDIASGNKNYWSSEGVLFSKDKRTLIQFPQGKTADYYEVPKGVTSIGEGAFISCSALEQIKIPASVTSIGGYAFAGCSTLAQVAIPSSITSIAEETFSGCEALTQVTIPSSVESIEDAAFWGCKGLADKDGFVIVRSILFGYTGDASSVVVPEGVTTVYGSAFNGCFDLAKIDVASGNKSCVSVDGVLFSKDKKTLIRFPPGNPADYYEVPEGVTSIGSDAFLGCEALTQVKIPNSVTSIGNWAFELCSSLEQVEIPASVTSIGHSAFIDCKALAKITIPSSVTSIGVEAFKECESLSPASITFADTSGWYFDKGFTQPAGADELASSLKDGKALYKEVR